MRFINLNPQSCEQRARQAQNHVSSLPYGGPMPSKRLSYKGFTRLGLVLMSAMAVSLASACTPVSSLSSSDGAAVPSALSGQPNASGKALLETRP